MDLIFRLIELLIRELMKEPGPNKGAGPVSLPGSAKPAAAIPPRTQPMAPRTQVGTQDPMYDDGGWRTAVAVLALIVLAIIAVAWFLYMRGVLTGG